MYISLFTLLTWTRENCLVLSCLVHVAGVNTTADKKTVLTWLVRVSGVNNL